MSKNQTIGTATRVCAVIGNPVSHSLSPAIHNAAYKAMGLDFVYVAHAVKDVKSALAGMRALDNFRGMSVTIPHKIEAMKYVDEIPEIDRTIGSINTVINDAGKLTGLGTDGPGALKALTDARVVIDGRRVLILGAGGAARAICFTLCWYSKPEQLVILDINEAMGRELAGDLKNNTDTHVGFDVLNDDCLANAMAFADIIIHCTPVGMHPNRDATLMAPGLFRTGQVVFDIVYTPLETRLLSDAAACGIKCISGVEMFINQAVLQFKEFTGVEAPVNVMRQVVMEHLKT